MKPVKTNAMRMLDKAKIPYELFTYQVDESNLSGTHVAEDVGLPYSQVFKTLVAKGDKTGYVVFVIPVDCEIDLKAAAVASKNKRVEIVLHMSERCFSACTTAFNGENDPAL